MHFHAASASRSAWRVPRVQRAFGEKALYFHSAKRRVKTRIDRLLKITQPFSPHSQTPTAPLERMLCIFTQLNGVSKQGITATSKQHSHSHLTAKHQTRLWQDSCLFQPNRTARQNADSHRSQTNTAILTSHPNVKRAVDDAFLQQNQGKRRRKRPQTPAPFAFKEIH